MWYLAVADPWLEFPPSGPVLTIADLLEPDDGENRIVFASLGAVISRISKGTTMTVVVGAVLST